MKCTTNNKSCPYHACMDDGCQLEEVNKNATWFGKPKCGKKMTITFQVTGGIWPGKYRSTSIQLVKCDDVEDAYIKAAYWANKNFSDYNHISTIKTENPLFKNISLVVPELPYVSRKN